MKTEEARLETILFQIQTCLTAARKESDGPWMRGHISGLTRALDFVIQAEIEKEHQSSLFSED